MTEHFRCVRLEARLSRDDCARRYRRAHRTRDKDISGMQQGFRGCGDCPTIGPAHARGERPEVELVQIVPVRSSKPIRPDVCLGCGGPLPRPGNGAAGRLRRRACSTLCREVIARGQGADYWPTGGA